MYLLSKLIRHILSYIIRQKLNDKAWFNNDCVNVCYDAMKKNAYIVTGPTIDHT